MSGMAGGFDAKAAYRRARLEYAYAQLKKEMRLFEASVQKRVEEAKNDAELASALESIALLEETDRFCKTIAEPKRAARRRRRFAELFNYRIDAR